MILIHVYNIKNYSYLSNVYKQFAIDGAKDILDQLDNLVSGN